MGVRDAGGPACNVEVTRAERKYNMNHCLSSIMKQREERAVHENLLWGRQPGAQGDFSLRGVGLGREGLGHIRTSRPSLLTASGGEPVPMVITCRKKQRGRVR